MYSCTSDVLKVVCKNFVGGHFKRKKCEYTKNIFSFKNCRKKAKMFSQLLKFFNTTTMVKLDFKEGDRLMIVMNVKKLMKSYTLLLFEI